MPFDEKNSATMVRVRRVLHVSLIYAHETSNFLCLAMTSRGLSQDSAVVWMFERCVEMITKHLAKIHLPRSR
jgi:hypothetical protein